MAIASGSSRATLVSQRTGYNRLTGYYLEKVWEGPYWSLIGLIGELNLAEDYVLERSAALWRITARFSAQQEIAEQPVDDLRMESHRILKSIYNHPEFASVDADQIRKVREAISNPQAGVSPALTDANAIDLYALLLAGVEHYPIYQSTLIKTRLASSQYAYNVAYANVGSIITPSRIAGDAAIVGLLRWNLPDDSADDTTSFRYGWLKHAPSVTTVSGNKRALIQEYEYGLWTTIIYDFV